MKNSFAHNLSLLRKERGYTQSAFADATNLKRNTIALYETGKRECNFDTLLLFAAVLNCSVDELLVGNESSTNKPREISQASKAGSIYILTNPSFPNYVKIGYSDNIETRLQQLNNTECTPFAFRVYATYDVDNRLSDKKIHSIIDKLNPDLRSIDNTNGKKRVREFYAMTAEDAYLLLEAIAEIHNSTHKLKKWQPTEDDIIAEEVAEKVSLEKRARAINFTFDHSKIPVGALLIHTDDPSIMCTVVDERRIEYNGETMRITPFAKMISGKEWLTTGPKYLIEHFTYNGVLLKEL